MVSADGGVFSFGDAGYFGSLSGHRLSSPVVAVAATPSGQGYWMAAADGGVFTFGDAPYRGAAGGSPIAGSVRSIVAAPDGTGYWLTARSGAVISFGGAYPVVDTWSPLVAVGRLSAVPSTSLLDAAAAGSNRGSAGAVVWGRPAAVPAALLSMAPVGSYRPGSLGVDISQYQCGRIPVLPSGIAVVQVTGGAIDNAPNPCYPQEARWAGPQMSAYIYLDGLPSPAPAASLSGPAGQCAITNIACASYNYGWNYARHWVTYSRRLGIDPHLWWLDVERNSGWQDPIANQLVIRGALDGLRSEHLTPGVYSSSTQWQEITGGLSLAGVDEWVPGAGNLAGPGYSATSFCAAPGTYSFGGGRLKMVQYGYQGPFPGSFPGPASSYDLDLAC